MCTSGFIKGALFGMAVSGAVYTMMPKKKTMCRRSTLGKGMKFVGELADSVADILR